MEVHNSRVVLGEGFLAVSAAESDSGRWGSVYLTDDADRPLALTGIPVGAAVALTATALSDNDRVYLAERRELLGVGAAEAAPVNAAGHLGRAVGIVPPDGRETFRLDGIALARLAGRRVRLEAHHALPFDTDTPEHSQPQEP